MIPRTKPREIRNRSLRDILCLSPSKYGTITYIGDYNNKNKESTSQLDSEEGNLFVLYLPLLDMWKFLLL